MDEEKDMNTKIEESEDLDVVHTEVEDSPEQEESDARTEEESKEVSKEEKETEEKSEEISENMEEISEEIPEEIPEEISEETLEEISEKISEEVLELEEDAAEELEPELQILEWEELDEDSEKEEHRGSVKSILMKIGIGLVLVVLAVYIGVSVYFFNHFSFNTTVNGMDQSFWSAERAESYMEQQVKEYALVIKRSDGGTEKISGDAFSLSYKKEGVFSELIKSQNPWMWPVNLFRPQELEASIGVEYDEEKLEEVLSKLNCMDEEAQTAPVSATPKYNGTQFEVEAEQPGTQVDKEIFFAKVKEAVQCFAAEFDMSTEGCYVVAEFTKESPEVQSACEQMNQYLTTKVTYVIGSKKEVVDQDVIQEWLFIKDGMEVALSSKKIKAYVATLADKYDTYGKERTITTASGKTTTVSGGDYGWKIDQDAEYKALISSLKNHEVVEREPEYSKTAASHDGAEWGDTYVEVDLTNQKVYLVKNGELILDTPCVTGNTSKGWITPAGVYSIKYLKKNAVLRGPKRNGVYEWESPVSFWMPFNGAIGLHDASWQTSFGKKDGYLLTGSRGCVNLQYDAAKMIFENATAGTPVICYFVNE